MKTISILNIGNLCMRRSVWIFISVLTPFIVSCGMAATFTSLIDVWRFNSLLNMACLSLSCSIGGCVVLAGLAVAKRANVNRAKLRGLSQSMGFESIVMLLLMSAGSLSTAIVSGLLLPARLASVETDLWMSNQSAIMISWQEHKLQWKCPAWEIFGGDRKALRPQLIIMGCKPRSDSGFDLKYMRSGDVESFTYYPVYRPDGRIEELPEIREIVERYGSGLDSEQMEKVYDLIYRRRGSVSDNGLCAMFGVKRMVQDNRVLRAGWIGYCNQENDAGEWSVSRYIVSDTRAYTVFIIGMLIHSNVSVLIYMWMVGVFARTGAGDRKGRRPKRGHH